MMRRLFCRSQVPEGDVSSSMVSYPSSLASSPGRLQKGVIGDVARSVWTTECIYMRTV